MKNIVKILVLILIANIISCPSNHSNKPNIVLIVVDDLGWKDLGCYGSTFYETPNIDRLAAEGMRFTNAYSSCPVCSPTRAALLTGKSPAKLRFTGHITAINRHRYPEHGRIIPPNDHMYIALEEITLAEALKPAGYATINIGKWHVGNQEKYYPTKQGFDINIAGYKHGSPPAYYYPYKDPNKEWNPEIPTLKGGRDGEYLTDRLTDEAIQFIEDSKDRPFFLYLPYYAVHTPLQAPEDLIQKYEKKLTADSSQKNAIYAAMIERMDFNIGRILARINDLGLDKYTLIIVTSDNGGLASVTNNAPLKKGKGWLYEGGIRIPLIIRWPGYVKLASICEMPTITHDLYPSITEIVAGAKGGDDIDGKSLLPLLKGEKIIWNRELYWYYPHYSPQAQQPSAAIRDGDYKLIHSYDPERLELFDLSNDLSEQYNLVEKMPEKRDELLYKLQKWLDGTNPIMHTMNPNYIKN